MSFNSSARTGAFARGVLAAFLWLTAHAATACAGTQAPPAPSSAQSLEGIDWKAIELAGKPVVVENASREPHLRLESGGRVSGSDGCNRIAGSFTVRGDNVTFGQMLGTLMACGASAESERAFRDALQATRRFRIAGGRLELFNDAGTRVAVLEAPQQAPPAASSQLQGTSWQLIRFRGGDDATLTPDDRTKYTIEFGADGRLTARVDCNRGRGTWTSQGSNQLQFGPLALTRAQCPAGSLHDQIVKQWSSIRSFVIKDGHLFLALMADGGTYEFEPLRT
jgi:heat shock protein HslJ